MTIEYDSCDGKGKDDCCTVVSKDGAINVTINNSTVTICAKCLTDGHDCETMICHCCNGNGNENGNGGDDDDDGIGGIGRDDDQPGAVKVTLLGGAKDDQFLDVVKDGDSYAAFGLSSSVPNGYYTPFVATFSKDLALTCQTAYSGGYTSGTKMVKMPNSSQYAFSAYKVQYLNEGQTRAALHNCVVAVDQNSKTVLAQNGQHEGVMTFVPRRLRTAPRGFVGEAALFEVGTFGPDTNRDTHGFITSYDKDMNVMNVLRLNHSVASSYLHLYDACIHADKVVAVGNITGVFTEGSAGLIVECNKLLEVQKTVVYESDSSLAFKFIEKTDYGYLIVATRVNKETQYDDIVFIGVDSNYKVIKRSVLPAKKDMMLDGVAMNALGDILLSGTLTGAGAGSIDAFVIRVSKKFKVTKELTFGSIVAENAVKAIFNESGSVTLVGGTRGAGAGGADAYIATFSGNWASLVGNVANYPALKINPEPGFTTLADVSLQRNNAVPITTSSSKFSKLNPTFATSVCNLAVNPGAI